jgi:hypothetical protein
LPKYKCKVWNPKSKARSHKPHLSQAPQAPQAHQNTPSKAWNTARRTPHSRSCYSRCNQMNAKGTRNGN